MSESEPEQEEEVTRCEYIFEPDDENRAAIQTALTEKWRCPHPAVDQADEDDLCIFHLPIKQKSAQDVRERFLECINMEGLAPKQFIGAEFPQLSVVNNTVGSNDHNPIDLRNTTFHGDVFFNGSSISQPIFLTDAEFKEHISAQGTRFFELFYAQDAEFTGGAKFSKARFYDEVNFRKSDFYLSTDFFDCTFQGATSFYGCEFDVEPETPTGVKAEVNHRQPLIHFSDATFLEGVNFNSAIFHDVPFLDRATAEDTVHLNNIELKEKYHTYEHVVPESDHVPEEQKTGHQIAQIGGKFADVRMSFEEVPDSPCIVSLEGTDIEEGHFSHPEDQYVYFDFTQASLGDITFKDMDSKEAWMHLIFNQTDFYGVDFTDYHTALIQCGFDICKVQKSASYDIFEDLELQERETTFLKAGIGADEVQDHRASSEFHIHELDTRRRRLWKECQIIPYLAHLIYGFTSRYGEKPSRVLYVFSPILLASYWFVHIQPASGWISDVLGLFLTLLPPIFSALLVLSSSRYIGN